MLDFLGKIGIEEIVRNFIKFFEPMKRKQWSVFILTLLLNVVVQVICCARIKLN